MPKYCACQYTITANTLNASKRLTTGVIGTIQLKSRFQLTSNAGVLYCNCVV